MHIEMADGHNGSPASHASPRPASAWEAHLAGDVLKDVSRSFYLTLQLLPKRVRGPICLGYLLARTSDTIADTESVPAAERLALLRDFHHAVETTEGISTLQAQLKERFQPRQTDPGETELLNHTEEAFAWLAAVSDFERHVTREVLHEILHGQRLDCQRFGEPSSLRFLRTPEELEEYTFLVAGSVGVFWTKLCFHHWDRYAQESEGTMIDWAKSYGRALQLINIVRDLPKDLEGGRCYLPIPEATEGQRPTDAALLAALEIWEYRCEAQMQTAMDYCQAIKPGRLRYATVLPLLLAERTLAQLRAASWEERMRGIKVPRTEVKAIMKRALVANLRPKKLCDLASDLRAV